MSQLKTRFEVLAGFAASVLLAIVAGVGCAHVDASGDFQRAGQLIEEHTGVAPEPSASGDDTSSARVEELLAGDLTVDQAVQIALLNNKEFLALFFDIGVSRAEVVQSGLLTNPSFSFIYRLPDGGGRPDVQVGFAQEIADLWQIPVKKKIARAQLEQTILRVVNRAIALAAEVKSKYYGLIASRLARETALQNVELMQQSVKSAEAQMKQGETSRLDVNLQRVPLLDANVDLLAAQRNERVAEFEFGRVLGLSRANATLHVASELPSVEALPSDTELVEFAMRQRVDAQMAAFQVQQAQKELRLQILKIFPSASVGFELERNNSQALPGRKILADTARASIANGALTAPSIQSRGERNIEKSQIVDVLLGPSLTVTLPIWDQNQAQIAKARFQVQQRRKEFENLLDQVALEVQRSSAQARTAIELTAYYEKEALPAADETVRGARQVYQQGEQSILPLLEAQKSFLSRRATFVDVRRGYAMAITELEAAVGGRLPSAATQPAVDSQPAQP